MKRRDNEFDNLILLKYCNLKQNILSISKELKCSRNTIVDILNENRVEIRKIANNKIPSKEIPRIIHLYLNNNYKAIDLSLLYNVSVSCILRILANNNIAIRKRKDYHKYPCNNDYFKVIDTEGKAYFLGLLYADGNISNKKQAVVRLTLQESDKEILEKLKKELSYGCPLSFSKSKIKNRQNTFTLYLCNFMIKENLISLGCIPRKSFLLRFPTFNQVPKSLVHHFIRGYFDGDGCICLAGTPTFSILSTRNMIENINQIFHENTGIGIKKLETHPNKINMQYRISGNKQIIKVYNFLYKDASLYLNRKFNKFQQLLNKEAL